MKIHNILDFDIPAVDCSWAEWSTWSQCSETCGDGIRTRTRTKTVTENHLGTCLGKPTETKQCNLESCGKMYCLVLLYHPFFLIYRVVSTIMIIVILLQIIFHMDPKQMFPWLTLLTLDGTCAIPEVQHYRHLM